VSLDNVRDTSQTVTNRSVIIQRDGKRGGRNLTDIPLTVHEREGKKRRICRTLSILGRLVSLEDSSGFLKRPGLYTGERQRRHIAEAVEYLWYSGHYLCVERGPL